MLVSTQSTYSGPIFDDVKKMFYNKACAPAPQVRTGVKDKRIVYHTSVMLPWLTRNSKPLTKRESAYSSMKKKLLIL